MILAKGGFILRISPILLELLKETKNLSTNSLWIPVTNTNLEAFSYSNLHSSLLLDVAGW